MIHSILGWLSRRSLRFLHALGALVGWSGYLFSPSYRQRLDANARLAGVGAAQRRAAVAEAGRMVMELPRLWLRPRGLPISDPVRWEGGELVDEHIASQRGLLLLTPHMGSFEVAAQSYAERYGARQPLTVLYRPARQDWLRELEATARDRPAMATAPATLAGVRQMLRALRRGETVGLLPDQVPPLGMGVWAPFFGQSAYTMTLAVRLARQTGAGLLLLWCERLSGGAGYVVRVVRLPEPLPENLASQAAPGDDSEATLAAAAQAVNSAMESLIRRQPAQYLWGYHRYKAPRSQEGPA